MTGHILLFYSPGAQSWQQFSLPAPQQGLTLGIGRGSDNALVITDPSVSAKHALLSIEPQGFSILDQNSSNGTAINGQWITPNEWTYIPPGSTFMLGDTTCRIEEIVEQPVVAQHIAPPSQTPVFQTPVVQPVKRRSALPIVIGGAVLVLIAAGGLVLWFKGDALLGLPDTGTNSSGSLSLQTLTLAADGSTQTDENGVSITIPEGALIDASAQLVSADLPDDLMEELTEGYKVLSPAYSLTGQGDVDGVQPGEITFPAEDEDLRLLAIIDGVYVAELDIIPENGVLALPADIHPSESGELAGTSAMREDGTIQFMLVRPKEDNQTRSLPPGNKLAMPVQQETPYNCYFSGYNNCWQNGNGSVQLMKNKDVALSAIEANKVINYIQSTMDKYEGLGFDGAIYTASNPVQVVVMAGAGTPSYKVANGVIYLPSDVALKIAGGGKDDFLNHEIAHWIQDESYVLTSAYYFDADTWWIETSAENMVMLVDPSYVSKNLLVYGEIDADEKNSVLQSSPFQWPMGEFYVHAQQLKVNICPGNCPLTQEAFVSAINNGTYPFTDETAKSKLHANLGDYARYLLGAAPLSANTTIPLDGVATGENYGDHIIIKQTVRSAFDLKDQVGYGRITPEDKGTIPGLLVQANLQKDGVYVLRVEIGFGDSSSQWPAIMRIEPGAPFYYRLNEGEVLYHDGKSQLIIQPFMSGTTGNEVTKLRLAAVGEQGGEVFKAHLSAVDLSGMWMMNMPDESAFINNLICEGEDNSDFISRNSVPFTGMYLMFGDFTPDLSSHLLTWAVNVERATSVLAPLGTSGSDSQSDSTMSAAATIDHGNIHLEGVNYQAEDTSFDLTDEGEFYQQYISIPGTFQFKADFDQLTYIGTESTDVADWMPNQLVWELSGGNIEFIIDCVVLDQRVSGLGQLEEEFRDHCSGMVEVPASVLIYQPKP